MVHLLTDGILDIQLTNTFDPIEDSKEISSNDVPENNPQYTTIYVGNLGSEATQLDLHRHFHALGAGVIEEVRVQRVFPNVWKGPTLDLMAGSLSGGTTVLFTYMLDLIQTKLAYQVVRPTDLNVPGMVNNEQVYRGIHDCLSKTYKEGGIRGLYRGVAPTLFGIFPYADLKFYFYEEMKLHVPEDYKKNIMAKLTCGSAAGSLGQTSHILLKLSGDKCRFKTLRHLKKPN